jgi:hypothetical protein
VAEAELVRDRPAMVMLGVAAFSAAVMAAVMSNRLDALDRGLPIHIGAAGFADRWGSPAVLWRIPLLATMITLMNASAAWFLAPSDRFASRFLIAASLVVHLLAWIALGDFLF